MTTVQITIHDCRYAAELCDLLVADGTHRVHLLNHPSPKLQGVVVADEDMVECLTASKRIELERCIVFVRQLDFDAYRLFNAGIRHVIHAGCSPEIGRLIVLAAEERWATHGTRPANLLFDTADKLFLQALGIAAVEAGLAATPLQSRDQ